MTTMELLDEATIQGRHIDNLVVATLTAVVILATGGAVALLALSPVESSGVEPLSVYHCPPDSVFDMPYHCDANGIYLPGLDHCVVDDSSTILYHCSGEVRVDLYHCKDIPSGPEGVHCPGEVIRHLERRTLAAGQFLTIYSPLVIALLCCIGALVSRRLPRPSAGVGSGVPRSRRSTRLSEQASKRLPADFVAERYCLQVAVWSNSLRGRFLRYSWVSIVAGIAIFLTWALRDIVDSEGLIAWLFGDTPRIIVACWLLAYFLFMIGRQWSTMPQPRRKIVARSGKIIDLERTLR